MEEEKYKVVATKVSSRVKKRIAQICRKKGLTEYDLLQMMCDCIVRYMDDAHNLTPEMERVMSMFEHMNGWKNAFNLADPSAEPTIYEAVYVMGAKGRKGARCMKVTRPMLPGQWMQDANVQHIFERMMEVLMPEHYMRMRQAALAHDFSNQFEFITWLVDRYVEDARLAEWRKEFEDCRAENGKEVRYGAKTKSVHHRSPDMYIQQGVIHFEPEDTPELEELKGEPSGAGGGDDGKEEDESLMELEKKMGYRPFGQDW